MSITLLRRNLRRKGFVPPANCRIDWDSPYAQNIEDLWLPYGDAGMNLARPVDGAPTVTGGTLSLTTTKWGRALGWSAGTYITIPSGGRLPLSYNNGSIQPFSIVMLFRPTSWASTNAAVFDKGASTTDYDVGFEVDGSSGGDATSGRVAMSATGGGGNSNYNVNVHHQLAFTVAGGATTDNYIMSRDGGQVLTAINPGGTNSQPSDASMMIGHCVSAAGINDSAMDLSFFGVWRRNLEADEVAYLFEDPFAMVEIV